MPRTDKTLITDKTLADAATALLAHAAGRTFVASRGPEMAALSAAMNTPQGAADVSCDPAAEAGDNAAAALIVEEGT